MGDNDKKSSLDPMEGMGTRAKEEADKEIEKQKAKLEQQKEEEK